MREALALRLRVVHQLQERSPVQPARVLAPLQEGLLCIDEKHVHEDALPSMVHCLRALPRLEPPQQPCL